MSERPDPLDGDFPVPAGPHRLRFACAVLLALALALGMVVWGVGAMAGWWS